MKNLTWILIAGGGLMLLLSVTAQARIHDPGAGRLVGGVTIGGYDSSLLLTNASIDLYPRQRWGLGADVWYWKRHDSQQSLATDIRIQRLFGKPRFGLWTFGVGVGWAVTSVENQSSDAAFSGNLTLEYKLRLLRGLWFTAGSTWMLYRNGYTAPLHAGLTIRLLPGLRATIGLTGIQSYLSNHEPNMTFESRPSLGLTLGI